MLTKTLRLNFNNQCMVDEAIYGSNGHHRVREDGIPLAKGMVCGNQETATLVAMGNQLKENGGFRLIFFDIAEVVEDEEVKAVQFRQGSWELELELGVLQLLHQGHRREELDALAQIDRLLSHGGSKMGFADTAWPQKDQVFRLLQPRGVLHQLHQRCAIEGGTMVKLKGGKTFSGGQLGLG